MSLLPDHLLANQTPSHAWAHGSFPTFPGPAAPDEATLVILPVHGLADHGLGLPLDVEEVVASGVLRAACGIIGDQLPLRVLPPYRYGLSPYPSTWGGLDPETSHDHLAEIAASVAAAGYRRLVFWVSSPWSAELIDAASRDIRVNLGLQTFVVEQAGLGLSLHPASNDRAKVQAVGAHLLGVSPETAASSGAPRDPDFRPGNYHELPPVKPLEGLDPAALLHAAAEHLSRLLAEIAARAPLGQTHHREPATFAVANAPAPEFGSPWSSGARARYLPSLTRRQVEAIPAKDRSLVVLTVGAIEQHGPHLPVGVDAIIGNAGLAEVSRHLSAEAAVYFAPPIVYGKSNEHAGYPGTVSISARTLRRVMRTTIMTWHAWGFRQFALLNTHGGNSAVLVYSIRELQTELDIRLGMLRAPMTAEISELESTWGFHAGEWETSLMLAIVPELVRLDRAVCHFPVRLTDPGELRPENAPAIYSWMTRDIAPDGVMGDATAATAAKGARWWPESMRAVAAQAQALL